MQTGNTTTLRERIGAASETTKTTLSDLLAADSNQVNPLFANSTDEVIDFSEHAESTTPPLPGTYWEGQGGIFVGTILDGETHYHLVMATKAFKGPWGEYGAEVEGEFSYSNGQHNTQLILAAQPQNELLLEITTHSADGHTDFYLPANFENNLICANAQKHIEKVWHWSSTQYSANDAWGQYFEGGYQYILSKYDELAARAVRRVLAI